MIMMMMVVVMMRMRMMLVLRSLARCIDHVHLRRRNPAAVYGRKPQGRAKVQRQHGLFEQGAGNARIHKSTQQHVSADSGETIKISDSHNFFES